MWLGFHLVAAIGGADMPVVISLLNSYSGVALAARYVQLYNLLGDYRLLRLQRLHAGQQPLDHRWRSHCFIWCYPVLHHVVRKLVRLPLRVPVLTFDYSQGMNRSLLNVVLGGFEEAEEAGAASPQGSIQQTTADQVADELMSARKVLIVPGYGMAVARCQSELADIAKVKLFGQFA